MFFNRLALAVRKEVPRAPDCSSGTKMSLGRSHFQSKKLQAVSNLFQNTCPRFSGMAPYRKISSHCCSDRLTVTVVATVAVTVIVTARSSCSCSYSNSHEHTDIQREKNDFGRSHLPSHGSERSNVASEKDVCELLTASEALRRL